MARHGKRNDMRPTTLVELRGGARRENVQINGHEIVFLQAVRTAFTHKQTKQQQQQKCKN